MDLQMQQLMQQPWSEKTGGCRLLRWSCSDGYVSGCCTNGEAEGECLCTAGVASIARVCWSQYTLRSPPARLCLQKMKRHDSRTPSLELIKYSFHQQMK
jgi:hypothetical protein